MPSALLCIADKFYIFYYFWQIYTKFVLREEKMDEDKPTATQHQQDGLALVFHCPPPTPTANHSSQGQVRSRQPFTLGV